MLSEWRTVPALRFVLVLATYWGAVVSWGLAVTSTIPVVFGVRWWKRRQQHKRIEGELRLALGQGESSVSSGRSELEILADDARLLCICLETPILRAESPLLSETPWARRERCAAYDIALANIRHDVWEWTKRVVSLQPHDKQRLSDMGLSIIPIRRLVFSGAERTSDLWEDLPYPKAPNFGETYSQIWVALSELKRFEVALRRPVRDPYREN